MKKFTIGLLSIALLGAGCLGGSVDDGDDYQRQDRNQEQNDMQEKPTLMQGDKMELSEKEIAAMFVVDQENENAPNGGMEVGCEDRLSKVVLELEEDKSQTDLAEAVVALLTTRSSAVKDYGVRNDVYAKGLYLDNIRTEAEGTRVLEFSGELSFAGVCEVPRFKGQIEETVKLYEDARIELNGSESNWECLGDQSGECA